MLKRAVGVAAVATLVLSPLAGNAAAPPDAIVGTWLTEDGSSRVDIAATRGADGATVYAGRVSWLRDPTRDGKPLHDANNENPGLRDRIQGDCRRRLDRRQAVLPAQRQELPGRDVADAGRPSRIQGRSRFPDQDRALDALTHAATDGQNSGGTGGTAGGGWLPPVVSLSASVTQPPPIAL
jgi:hypothetical protein